MITRNDLNGKNQEELQTFLNASVAEYKAYAETIETEEEVSEKEQEIMKMMDEYQEYMAGVQYEIPEECKFDGQVLKKKAVAELIVNFIETQEVQWDYVNGLYELCKIWKDNDLKFITYGAYDSTLRILGSSVKYKGMTQWRNLLIVNQYLSSCHEEYVKDASYQIYLSHCHNALMDQMKEFHPETVEVNESQC